MTMTNGDGHGLYKTRPAMHFFVLDLGNSLLSTNLFAASFLSVAHNHFLARVGFSKVSCCTLVEYLRIASLENTTEPLSIRITGVCDDLFCF